MLRPQSGVRAGRDVGDIGRQAGLPRLSIDFKQTNPGGVTIEPGRSYPITGKNKAEATYYQITVEGASPAQRWVEVACGDVNGAEVTPTANAHAGGVRATHVLALGWEPAFCLEHADKTECAGETGQSFAASHLSLHGLWPQPREGLLQGCRPGICCGGQAPRLGGPARTGPERRDEKAPFGGHAGHPVRAGAARMDRARKLLRRHGRFYFNRAAELVQQINASGVGRLFAQTSASLFGPNAILAAFDQSFGAGPGARVTVSCQGHGSQRTIGELVISLAGDVAGSAPFGDLIRTAASSQPGCPAGLVVQPGTEQDARRSP